MFIFCAYVSRAYTFTLNKIQTQEQNLKQIQENYSRDIPRIDEIYQEMINN